MSVVKATVKSVEKPIEKPVQQFKPSPMNALISELRSKLNENKNIFSGNSDEHKIPACSSGIIICPIDVDFEYIPHITLQCNDSNSGINCYVFKQDNNKQLHVVVENLLDVERLVKINYILL